MPVTKSAKKALSVSLRRKGENLIDKNAFKRAVKDVRKAVAEGAANVATLFSTAQSNLDRAAKSKTIHPNKAARLKSRLAKKMAAPVEVPVAKPVRAKKAASTASKKTTAAKKKA